MRKEINLPEITLVNLKKLAEKKKWSLKKYMEVILEKESQKSVKKDGIKTESSQ